jgi:hypothetical protein
MRFTARPLRESTIFTLSANEDACADQSHAADGHDYQRGFIEHLHHGGRTDYTTLARVAVMGIT